MNGGNNNRKRQGPDPPPTHPQQQGRQRAELIADAAAMGPPAAAGTEAKTATQDASLRPPPSPEVLKLWIDVGKGLDKNQTVVWKKAVESLQSAYEHLATNTDARQFAETYARKILEILAAQSPTKIGLHERASVQKAMEFGCLLVVRDLQIRIQNQNKNNHQHQQGQSQPRGGIQHQQPPAAAGSGSTSASAAAAAKERDLKKQKEKFHIFTRVLMKYLEQKDPPLHQKVKAIIKDCAIRNRNKEPGYESVTASMKIQLRKVVNDNYWKRAEAYLDHFLKAKAKEGSQSAKLLSGSSAGGGGGSGSTGAASAKSGGGSSSSEAQKQRQIEQLRRQQQIKQQQAQAQQEKQRRLQHQQKQQQQQQSQQQPVQANLSSIRDEMAKKQRQATQKTKAPSFQAQKGKASSGGKRGGKRSSTPTSTSSTQQRRGSAGGGGAAAAAETVQAAAKTPAPAPSPPPAPVVREYHELMQHVDHAVNYDWTVAGSILGAKTALVLNEEQQKLLQDSKGALTAAAAAAATDRPAKAFPIPGWDQRNVVSTRTAWARLRLPMARAAQKNPSVGGVGLSLPHHEKSRITMEKLPSETATSTSDAVPTWYNEEVAEDDALLAVLSEGTQLFLKSVLEKALHSARQRQNLDGIRLWYEQHSGRPTALSLRLGCDMDRQVALAEGNAAMTYKRMEEALERSNHSSTRIGEADDASLLEQATSMGEASLLLPKVSPEAIAKADLHGKRKFEVYGGKHSGEPPFGKVPKTAKLEVIDFQTGMHFGNSSRRLQQRAAPMSGSFFF